VYSVKMFNLGGGGVCNDVQYVGRSDICQDVQNRVGWDAE
jgi:hypothetical protein